MKKTYAQLIRALHIVSSPVSGLFLHNSRRVRVLVICGDYILLQRSSFGPQKWSLPGGGIERDESEARAAIREIAEETNVVITEKNLRKLGEKRVPAGPKLYKKWPMVNMIFLVATIKSQTEPQVIRPLEVLEVQWFPLSKLPDVRSKTVNIGLSLLRGRSA